jgi:alpha-tubulin suppressor-like RCC1 family protein
VLCWGYNNKGQLGDGTDVSRLTPVSVVDLSTGVAAIAAGNEHTCALLIAGGVKCWGENGFGQLGDGTIVDSFSPVDVNGLPAAIASVAAGEKHTCAASIGGVVLCWGFNESGQLGDGTLATHLLPTSVASLTGTAVQVSVGKAHSCARLAGGFLECWGANFYGQVGDGSTSNRLVPVESSRRSGELTAIALGAEHTCAQTSRGSLKCWGHNNRGQVGDGVPTTRLLPVGVVGFFGVGIELFLPILHR